MLAWLLSAALASTTWSGVPDTAGTVDAGEVVVRLPYGRSSVGLSEKTELMVIPLDVPLRGTRVGVEHEVGSTQTWTVSVVPSAAMKWSGGRVSTRVDALAARTWTHHRAHLGLSSDARLLRQTTLGETRTVAWSLERVDVPLTVAWDWMPDGASGRTMVRTKLRTPLHDEGEALNWLTAQAGWLRRCGAKQRLHIDLGVGTLVGQPTEHIFLGDYSHTLVMAWPRVDVWLQF